MPTVLSWWIRCDLTRLRTLFPYQPYNNLLLTSLQIETSLRRTLSIFLSRLAQALLREHAVAPSFAVEKGAYNGKGQLWR